MRPILVTAFIATATPALADTDISALIRDQGLAATEAHLAALPDPTAAEVFGLGGVRFLSGIEAALQTRYRVGLSDDLGMFVELPVLRLPIPENPNPEPFEPALIADLFTAVLSDMQQAATTLDGVAGDFVLTIDTDDIWFDIDGNGTRSPGEDLGSVAGIGLGAQLPAITVNFDTADAQWLRAYANLLAGVSELVLAFDPTTAITEVRDGRAALDALNATTPVPYRNMYDMEFGDYVDYAAIVLSAIQVQPDATRTRAAQAHFLTMVQANRDFWRLVALETDNDAEWIPNKNQQSATGLVFPADTGQVWLRVLAEAEAVLTGNALIPYWRLNEGAGIDLNALMQDPPEVDLIGMIQGMDLVPYATTGRVMNWESLALFTQMTGGNAGLFMVMLN